MSTIKSSSEHLTLNADGASKDIKFQANGVEKASISSAGAFTSTTIDATALTGALPAISGASLTNVPAANITGTLPAIDGSNLTGMSGGITEADQWRLTTQATLGNDVLYSLNANWERVDTYGFGKLGTGMSESSGAFTFPSTGVWLIQYVQRGHCFNVSTRYWQARINTTTNNSTYSTAALTYASGYNSGSGTQFSASTNFLFDVTDVSTHKVNFSAISISGGFVHGNSDSNSTHITFIKLGDT